MLDIDINFEDEDGFLCDLVVFKDINNEVLGIAKIDSMNFTLPIGTYIFDYYHQFDNTRPQLTRCILGTREDNVTQNDPEKKHFYVRCQNNDVIRIIQADTEGEDVDIKLANNEDEFIKLLQNEMLTRKYLKESLQKDVKNLYESKKKNAPKM